MPGGVSRACFGTGWASVGGSVAGGVNAWLSGGNVLAGAVTGGIASAVGSMAGTYAAQGANVVINGVNITSPVLKGTIAGFFGGAAAGYLSGFAAAGMNNGWDMEASHKAGWNSAISAGLMGGISGGIAAYKYSVDNNINPWTGKYKGGNAIIGGPQSRVDNMAKMFDMETINNNKIENWPSDMLPYLDKDIPNPSALEFNRVWIETIMESEYYIYDIGRNVPGYSPFYNGIEIPAISDYPFSYRVREVYAKNTISIFIIIKR